MPPVKKTPAAKRTTSAQPNRKKPGAKPPAKRPARRRSPRTKLNDKTVETKLIEALTDGAYREEAALYAGISVSTFYRWMKEGEAAATADPPETSRQRELWEAVKNAEAGSEIDMIRIVRTAAVKQWQAAAWWLERKNPGKWGRFERIEHSGTLAGEPQIVVPSDDQALQIAAILKDRGALDTEVPPS